MQAMQNTDRFWKVTGRLEVMTLNKIVNSAPPHFEICADFRHRRDQVDTQLIAFNIIGYKKYIDGKLHEMPGLIIESWLFKKLVPLLGTHQSKGIETEFRAVAKFEGFACFKSANYMSPKQQLIYFVRSIYLTTKYFFKSN